MPKKADIYRPFFLLFTADSVFFEPGFEGHIFGRGGGVATTTGVADAEELFAVLSHAQFGDVPCARRHQDRSGSED